MTAIIVEEGKVRPVADLAKIRDRVAAGAFFWLDLVGEDKEASSTYLLELGLDGANVAWALRFGQTGRMHIGPQKLRAVTWIADRDGALVEIHLIGSAKGIASVWGGDPTNSRRNSPTIRRSYRRVRAQSLPCGGNPASAPPRNA